MRSTERRRFMIPAAILGLLVSAAVVPVVGATQAPEIEIATLPLPPALRAGAAVLAWTDDDTLRLVREGDNGHFCILDEDDGTRLSLQCQPMLLRAYLERSRALREMDRRERDELLAAEVRGGDLFIPHGALSHHASGRRGGDGSLPESVSAWREIAIPFADGEGAGIKTSDDGPIPWMHHPGEYRTHVMVGLRTVTWSELVAGEH